MLLEYQILQKFTSMVSDSRISDQILISKGDLPSPKIHALQGHSVLQSNILLLMKPIVVLPVTISVKMQNCFEEQNFNGKKKFD